MSLPYRGPLLVATAAEAARIDELLHTELGTDYEQPGDAALAHKCRCVKAADSRWKQPTR